MRTIRQRRCNGRRTCVRTQLRMNAPLTLQKSLHSSRQELFRCCHVSRHVLTHCLFILKIAVEGKDVIALNCDFRFRLFKAGSAGVEWVGWEDGVWPCGVGIAQEYPQGRRPSHAVVAGYGAVVDWGWYCVVSVACVRSGRDTVGLHPLVASVVRPSVLRLPTAAFCH